MSCQNVLIDLPDGRTAFQVMATQLGHSLEECRKGQCEELESEMRTSMVVQWLRICLPMQGTWVQSLVREDSTFHMPKPMHHNY